MTASWAASVGISICWTNRFRARQATALILSHRPATTPSAAPPAKRFQGFIPVVVPSVPIRSDRHPLRAGGSASNKLFALTGPHLILGVEGRGCHVRCACRMAVTEGGQGHEHAERAGVEVAVPLPEVELQTVVG